jgi:hypothetical protein
MASASGWMSPLCGGSVRAALHFRHIGECARHRQRRIFTPSRVVSLICINHSA